MSGQCGRGLAPNHRLEVGHQQLEDHQAQGLGQALHAVHADVPLPPFHGSDVGAMKARKVGQFLLGNATSLPRHPEIGGEDQAGAAALGGR